MEAGAGEDVPEDAPEDSEDAETLLEVVYPYGLSEQMLREYADPAHNRMYSVDVYREVLLKLLRSARYWRMTIPKWLPGRLRNFGVL